MFGLMMISDVTSKIILKDNAIFQQKPEVTFSESSWTIITDLDFKPAEKRIQYLESSFTYYLNNTNEWSANSTVHQMVSKRLESRIGLYRQDLVVYKERIFIFRTSTGDFNNHKRLQLASGGGPAFKRINSTFFKRRLQYNNSLMVLNINILGASGSFHTTHRHRSWNLRRLPTLALTPQNDHPCEVRAGDGRDRHAAG